MKDQQGNKNNWAERCSQNTKQLRYWTAAWVLTSALMSFGPKFIWNYDTAITLLSVLINLGVGFKMILVNKQHLRGMDELHQKIFLDAGILSLGVGLVCGLTYDLLQDIRLISFEPKIAHLVILMCLTFMTGIALGHRRYR